MAIFRTGKFTLFFWKSDKHEFVTLSGTVYMGTINVKGIL